MITTSYRLLLSLGLALTLSSCDVFKPDQQPDANANQYGAADAYNANNNTGGYPPYQQPQGNNPYGAASGAYGATNNAPGAYGAANNAPGAYGGNTQPNYGTPNYNTPNYNTPNYNNAPYTQPPDNPYSTGTGAAAASGRTHVVATGESLSKIAQRYGTTTDAIVRANNITDPNRVRAGQTLTIP